MAFGRRRGPAGAPVARGLLFGAGVAAMNRPKSSAPPASAATPTVIVVEAKGQPQQPSHNQQPQQYHEPQYQHQEPQYQQQPQHQQKQARSADDYDDGVGVYRAAPSRPAPAREVPVKVVYGSQTKIIPALPRTYEEAMRACRVKFGIPSDIPSILTANVAGEILLELDDDSYEMLATSGDGVIHLSAEAPFKLAIAVGDSIDAQGAYAAHFVLANPLDKVAVVVWRVVESLQLAKEDRYQLMIKGQPMRDFMRLCDYSIGPADTVRLEKL